MRSVCLTVCIIKLSQLICLVWHSSRERFVRTHLSGCKIQWRHIANENYSNRSTIKDVNGIIATNRRHSDITKANKQIKEEANFTYFSKRLANWLRRFLFSRLCSTSALLQQQLATISFAARAFCATAPTVWSSLGVQCPPRSADTFLTFKNRLKTELFKFSYS